MKSPHISPLLKVGSMASVVALALGLVAQVPASAAPAPSQTIASTGTNTVTIAEGSYGGGIQSCFGQPPTPHSGGCGGVGGSGGAGGTGTTGYAGTGGLGGLFINETLPVNVTALGGPSKAKAWARQFMSTGLSISLNPVSSGWVRSPLTSALAFASFSPQPSGIGSHAVKDQGLATWDTNANKSALYATRPTTTGRNSIVVSFTGTSLKIAATVGFSDPGHTLAGANWWNYTPTLAVSLVSGTGAVWNTPLGAGQRFSQGSGVGCKPNSGGSFAIAANPCLTPILASTLNPTVNLSFSPDPPSLASLTKIFTTAFSPSADLTQQPRQNPGSQAAQSSPGCGSVMGQTSAGLAIASGFLDIIPVVGSSLGAVTTVGAESTSLMGTNAGDACITAQFSLINGQLADQEGQIQSLQTQETNLQNQIYKAMVDGANAQSKQDLTTYNTNLQTLSPAPQLTSPGIFGQTMQDLGFWNLNYSANANASIAGSSSGQPYFLAVSESSNAPTFQTALNNISGSAVTNGLCSLTSCPKSAVISNPSSSLTTLWSAEAQQLQITGQADRNAGINVVPLFDDYNNEITAQFQNSLGVIQQAYSLESMVNQLNYDHATADCTWGQAKSCTMISTFGGVPGTWYQYCYTGPCAATTTQAQTMAYNAAQQQLAQVYSWRVQKLYAEALGFIDTDTPIGPQSYPTDSATGVIGRKVINTGPIPYGSLLGASLTSAAGVASTPLAALPTSAVTSGGSSWESNGALYQYSGIFDANQCATTIMAANAANGASAPPPASPCNAIFLTGQGGPVDQATYTGNVLEPYTSQPGSVTLTGLEQANLLMCTPSNADLSWYTPPVENTGNAAGLVSGSWYLNCGNWATVSSTTSTKANCFPGASCPLGWQDPAGSYPWLTSQYYDFGTGSYPDLSNNTYSATMDFHGASGMNVSFNGSCSSDPTPVAFYNNPSFPKPGSGSEKNVYGCGAGMYVTNPGSTYQGITGLRTNNQTSSESGLQIPLAWNESNIDSSNERWSWEPEQVPAGSLGTYGFSCSGLTCTMADGSVWNVTSSQTGYQNTTLILGITQQGV